MKRVLITGSSGFVGRHLTGRLMTSPDLETHGFDLRAPDLPIPFTQGDILDRAAVRRALESARPDVIFHLSGLLKSDDEDLLQRVHVQGTTILYEAAVESGLTPRVIVASSSAVYGPGSGKRPISEEDPLRPVTPYARSKAAQEAAALRFPGLETVIARMFNLLGPGLSPLMACSAFAKQIAEIEAGKQAPFVMTGNLGAKRDFVDVRDAVRALELLATHGQTRTPYNICSGRAVRMQACLAVLMQLCMVTVEQRLDPGRLQTQDVPIQVGDPCRLQQATGWYAATPVEQSLSDMLHYWREQSRHQSPGST